MIFFKKSSPPYLSNKYGLEMDMWILISIIPKSDYGAEFHVPGNHPS